MVLNRKPGLQRLGVIINFSNEMQKCELNSKKEHSTYSKYQVLAKKYFSNPVGKAKKQAHKQSE
jgi:hypothetical protein